MRSIHITRALPITYQLSRPLPALDPGKLPTPYIELSSSKGKGKDVQTSKVRDLDAEQAQEASTSAAGTLSAPAPPPSALPKGKQLTKKEKKAVRTPFFPPFTQRIYSLD